MGTFRRNIQASGRGSSAKSNLNFNTGQGDIAAAVGGLAGEGGRILELREKARLLREDNAAKRKAVQQQQTDLNSDMEIANAADHRASRVKEYQLKHSYTSWNAHRQMVEEEGKRSDEALLKGMSGPAQAKTRIVMEGRRNKLEDSTAEQITVAMLAHGNQLADDGVKKAWAGDNFLAQQSALEAYGRQHFDMTPDERLAGASALKSKGILNHYQPKHKLYQVKREIAQREVGLTGAMPHMLIDDLHALVPKLEDRVDDEDAREQADLKVEIQEAENMSYGMILDGRNTNDIAAALRETRMPEKDQFAIINISKDIKAAEAKGVTEQDIRIRRLKNPTAFTDMMNDAYGLQDSASQAKLLAEIKLAKADGVIDEAEEGALKQMALSKLSANVKEHLAELNRAAYSNVRERMPAMDVFFERLRQEGAKGMEVQNAWAKQLAVFNWVASDVTRRMNNWAVENDTAKREDRESYSLYLSSKAKQSTFLALEKRYESALEIAIKKGEKLGMDNFVDSSIKKVGANE